MKTLTKINRRVWIALEMQARRRKRVRFAHPAVLPAPVLHAVYPSKLAWDWDLPNPHKWNVWMSLDNGSSWTLIEDYWTYGAGRLFAPDGGHELYYIVGVDAGGNEITGHSNIVRPDDAVGPVPMQVQGLQLWVRVESLAALADGDPVATWPDESGHETHLAQSDPDAKPVYRVNTLGQPSVQFDGIDDVLTSVASVFKPDLHTIFVVAKPDATGENDILGTGNTDNGDALLMIYSNHLRGHAWRGYDANVLDGATPINADAVAIFEQTVSETDITLRLDGDVEATQAMTGEVANTRKWVYLGSRNTGSHFNGHILAVLVYDCELTESEANFVRQYLIDTYAVITPYPAVTLQTDLAGYWTMDEDAGNDRLDSSVNGRDLQEWSFEEAMGNASDTLIPRTGGVNNYAASFLFGPGQGLVSFAPNDLLAGDFTFSCWVNYNADEGFDGQGLISLGGAMAIGIRAYTGATDIAIYDAVGGNHSYVISPEGAFTPYQWAHAVYVKDGSTLRIYVNGEEVVNGPYLGDCAGIPVNYFTDSDLIVGINPWGYPLVGAVDEVGCWSRALSADEVYQLYNYGSGLPFENF